MGADRDPSPADDPGRLDPPLTADLIKQLLDAGQGGEAEHVLGICEARLAQLGQQDHLERFWLRYVQFFCAQGADTGLEQDRLVEDLLFAAERCGISSAVAAALACRALLAATRGRYAEANPDLGRAVVVLSEADEPTAEDWPVRHCRRMACNTLALAFNRQGFHDLAVDWLHVTRHLIHSQGVADSFGTSVVTFNEARVHLAAGLEQELGEVQASEPARNLFRRAARLFGQAADEAANEPGLAPILRPGRLLAAVARTFADGAQTAPDLPASGDPSLRRPDHLALLSLALAQVYTARGEIDQALAELERAGSALPPDHSFRSMAARIQWEAIRITSATPSDALVTAHRGMIDILLGERRSEFRTRRAAYEERLQQELDRSTLIAERAAAELDPLTGLLSRRNLDTRLRAAASAIADDRTAFLVFIDLDQFKLVNDHRSHLAGDLTLRHLGETIRPSLDGDDFAVRYGGDEFILVLFDRSAQQIKHELARLRGQLLEITSADPEIRTPVTFTAGVLPFDATAGPDELLHRADLAMIAERRATRGPQAT